MKKVSTYLFNLERASLFFGIFLIALSTLVIYATTQVRAVQVSSLPDDNLLSNPWFRSDSKPNASGLDYWIDASSAGLLWSTSQKSSNPTPDVIVSRKCGGSSEMYCGTSARFADGRGQGGGGAGQSGQDAYLYQVVQANPEFKNLKFKTHWVTGEIEEAKVTVYGSASPSGPWSVVWVPFYVDSSSGSGYAWDETNLLETELTSGWSYYKVELHGRYPLGTKQGVKYTGVYFNVVDESGNSSGPTPTTVFEPTPTDTIPTEVSPTPELTPTPTIVISPSPTPILEDNTTPVLRTRSLSSATVGQEYVYTLTGYDEDESDELTMVGYNLPAGFSVSDCFNNVVRGQVRSYCDLVGTPLESGIYQVTVVLSDQLGASNSKTFNLVIN